MKRFIAFLDGIFAFNDKRIPADPKSHKVYLCLSVLLVVLPFFLTVTPDKAADVTLANWRLPPTCFSKRFFNVQCPGCGMTHSFVLLAHGQPRQSLQWHRLGIALYLYFVYQVLFRIYVLRRPEAIHSQTVINTQHYLSVAMILLLLFNWVGGFYLGSNGS